MNKRFALLFSLMVLGFPSPSAAIVQHVPKQVLCDTTDFAIVGKVSSISSYYSNTMGMIVSDVTFNVERTVKGTHVSSRTVFVMGGTLNTGEHLTVSGMPNFVVGERYFLLLHDRSSQNPTIRIFLVSIFAIACRNIKDPGSPCTAAYGSLPMATYIFNDHNYSCETDPIDQSFTVDASDILSKLTESPASTSTTTNILNDLDEAIAAWVGTGAAWKMDYSTGSMSNEDAPSGDSYNQIDMLDDVDPYVDGDVALGYAFSIDIDEDGTTDYCDVILYTKRETDSSTIVWSVDDTPASTETDMARIVAHEIGHCIGIGDQNAPDTAADLMYGSNTLGTDFTGLATNDEEAILYIYGI